MNSLVKDVARTLRYRPLPHIVGHVMTVSSVAAIVGELERNMIALLPRLRFHEARENNTALSLAKYGIVDLTFNISGVEWEQGDAPGISILEQLGFVLRPGDVSDDTKLIKNQDTDPTCLEELRNDIIQNRNVLRLFIEEQARRNMKEHMLAMAKDGGISDAFVDRFFSTYFPKDLIVSDACLTNAPFIWFHSHFWM